MFDRPAVYLHDYGGNDKKAPTEPQILVGWMRSVLSCRTYSVMLSLSCEHLSPVFQLADFWMVAHMQLQILSFVNIAFLIKIQFANWWI